VDEITEQAREVRFWHTVLTAVAGLLFGVGWLAAKACAVLWLGAAWSVTAVKVGWREARRGAARTG
jgi:hypothetical protein